MERNALIDKLKGYACFLVLFGHVIMGIRLAGINIPSFFQGIEQFVWSFHVALFMFLSGVVYTKTGQWQSKKTKFGFIKHKFLNLGIPYVVFSVVYILINCVVGGANNQSSFIDILYIWKTPVAQYWFLYALFFLFLIWTLLGGILKNWQIMLITVFIGYISPVIKLPLGSLDVVFYSALPFGLGTFVDFEKMTKPADWVKGLIVLLHILIGVVFILLHRIEDVIFKEVMILLGIYSSIMFISLVQKIKPVSSFLLFVNKYSFQIYLLHTIFTSGIRIVLQRINVTEWWIHVILGTVCGLLFSVLVALIAKKIRFLNFFFFPTKTIKVLKEKK